MAQENDEQRGIAGRPLVFGEIVFDELDGDEHQPGGAPLNVAWHLRGFGLDPLFVSRVGNDALGGLLLERLRAGGLDTSYVQIDTARPTGKVVVGEAGSDEPRFTIPDDQAYDYIDSALLPDPAQQRFAFLYHGTLAARRPVSAAALGALRAAGLPTFVDVNLRSPWWERRAVEALVGGSLWLKLNTNELLELEQGPARTPLQRAAALRRSFALGTVIVTCGEQGSLAVTGSMSMTESSDRVTNFVDSVGAGDAFSAVLLLGFTRGWSLQLNLRRAAAFAAAICGVRGALPPDDSLYQRFSASWRP